MLVFFILYLRVWCPLTYYYFSICSAFLLQNYHVAQHLTPSSPCLPSAYSNTRKHPSVGTISILQKKLELWEVKWLAYNHKATKKRTWSSSFLDWVLAPTPPSLSPWPPVCLSFRSTHTLSRTLSPSSLTSAAVTNSLGLLCYGFVLSFVCLSVFITILVNPLVFQSDPRDLNLSSAPCQLGYLSVSWFPRLQNGCRNSTNLTGLFWGLKDVMAIKCLEL